MISSSHPIRIAFVIPWYGNIPGGAESECKNTAEKLSKEGYEIEILTTCAKEFLSDWGHDYYQEGVYYEGGLTVRRFSLRKRDTTSFDKINYKLMNNKPISSEEEKIYIHEMINSDNLYQYIRENGECYDYFIFIPYMFGTTFYGTQIWPEKTILIPCLHDESYAYLDIYKPMFNSCRLLLFNTEPEKDLFNKIITDSSGQQFVIGIGLNTEIEYDPKRFLKKYRIEEPFLLYAGRRDSGKNVDELINYFGQYIDKNVTSLKLTLIGKGEVTIPTEYKDRIIDLGFIPLQDKYDAYAASSVFCLPSTNESFSIVMMEAWLCKTPNLVNSYCEVTKSHCILSNGGLFYENYDEFDSCLSYLMEHPKVNLKMGLNGYNYVIKNYKWDVIISKYRKIFQELQ